MVPTEGFEPATSRLSTWCLCQIGLRRLGAPPRIRTGNLSLLRRAPLPSWARGAIERTPEMQKAPAAHHRGGFSRSNCLLFGLHVYPPGDRQRKVTKG